MAVSQSVKDLPSVEESVPRTVTLRILAAPPPMILDAYAEPATVPTPPRPGALLREVAWALTASASLFGMSSVASAVVYVILFP